MPGDRLRGAHQAQSAADLYLISGYGQFGPESARKQYDYDNVSQARSGIQYGTGEILPEGKTYDEMSYAVPTKRVPGLPGPPPEPLGHGILSAVYYRGLTGEGQAIEHRNAGSLRTAPRLCSPLVRRPGDPQ